MANRHNNQETYQFPTLDNIPIETIVTDSQSAELLVKAAEEIGRSLAKPAHGAQLSTSQIRAIFGEVRRIEGKWKGTEQERNLAKRQLILLKPKMAYRAEKEKTPSVKNLVNVLDKAIDVVDGDDKNFTRFVDFFEAILAYHKANGGK